MADNVEALHLEVVVAALQDPTNGVRLFVREKNGKKRACFHGASVRESLKQYGFEDAKRVAELVQRLIDAELIAPFKSSEGGSEFKDDRAYFFAEQIVLSRSYIGDNLARALAYFASTPYKKGLNASTIVTRRKKERNVDLGIFGVDTEVVKQKDKERQSTAPDPRGTASPRDSAPRPERSRPSDLSASTSPNSSLSSLSTSTSSIAPQGAAASTGAEQPPQPKLIEEDTDEIQFAFNDDDPIPVVKAATLDKLIERLTYEEYIDMRFQINFMMTYRAYLTPLQLLEKLRERFAQREGDKPELQKKRQVRQLRVLAVISRWVQHYSEPWVESDELRKALSSFLEQVNTPFPQLARQISENLHRAQENAALQRASLVIPNEPAPATAFVFDDGTVNETAQQLTLYGSLLFASIRGSELLGLAWSKKGKEEKAANILRYISNFNRVSGWVVHAVCTTISLKQRAAVLARVIGLAQRCRELNNFHHAMAVFAALVSAPVRRLKATWAELPQSTQDTFKALETLFSHSSSYKTYREALREAPLPCVPYLGLALTDLTFIEEGNPEKIKNLLNFQRHMLVAKVLESVHRLQTVLPRYPRNPAVMHWIQNLKTLSGDEEAYQMSLKIEPRNTMESLEQMLMEEEKLRARLQTAEVKNAELEAEVARLKAHIAKLDADLRAALKGEGAESAKSRSSSGAAGVQLAETVRPKWAAFTLRTNTNDLQPVQLPPPPPLASSPTPSSLPIDAAPRGSLPPPLSPLSDSSRSNSGRDAMVGGMRLPPPPSPLSSSPTPLPPLGAIGAALLPSPPSSPGRNAPSNTGSGFGSRSGNNTSTDWARTRPSPRPISPRNPDAGDTGSLRGVGVPETAAPDAIDPTAGARGDASPIRGATSNSNKRMLTPTALASLKAPPAPPPSRDAHVLPPANP